MQWLIAEGLMFYFRHWESGHLQLVRQGHGGIDTMVRITSPAAIMLALLPKHIAAAVFTARS